MITSYYESSKYTPLIYIRFDLIYVLWYLSIYSDKSTWTYWDVNYIFKLMLIKNIYIYIYI